MTSPSFQEIKKQLKENQYAVFPFAFPKEKIDRIVNAFMKFLELPDEDKKSLLYRIEAQERGSEVGYNIRVRKEGDIDDRVYFHYHPDAERGFAEQRKTNKELNEILTAMKPLYEQALETTKQIISLFEKKFPGVTEKFFKNDIAAKGYLRIVAYNQQIPGDLLAQGHFDRGSCTLAIAESSPGLRIGTSKENVKNAVYKPNKALFFGGIRFPDATDSTYKAAWHDVVQKEQDAFSKIYTRWAIVFFLDAHDMRYVTWEEAHALTQKRI